MEKWNKYTYLNTDTDSLIEISKIDGSGESLIFTLNNSPYVLLSVADVTIKETTTESGTPMETKAIFTTEYLESTLIEKQHRINELEGKLISLGQHSNVNLIERQSLRDSMQAWTLDELGSCGINEDQAEAIAEICGFELSTEVEVEVTVVYNLTLQVTAGEDAEDVISEIDFDAITYDTDKIVNVYSSVDNINI